MQMEFRYCSPDSHCSCKQDAIETQRSGPLCAANYPVCSLHISDSAARKRVAMSAAVVPGAAQSNLLRHRVERVHDVEGALHMGRHMERLFVQLIWERGSHGSRQPLSRLQWLYLV